MHVLIIRFSSFGDIFQALEAAKHLADSGTVRSIDWLVRDDFAALLENQKNIRKVHRFDRKSSVFSLMARAWAMAPEYTHVYDAHSNLRSFVVRAMIRLRWSAERVLHPFGPSRSMIRRSKERLRRLLFFRFRLKTLPMPYRGAESYLWPLRQWLPNLEFNFASVAWNLPVETNPPTETLRAFKTWRLQKADATLIALAPSAAWPNKRWPIDRWRLLVSEWLETSPDSLFLLLGGPDDQFLNAIENEFGPARIFNAVAKTSLLESALLLGQADALVANDTGLLHVADRLQIPSVAIIGPTAFGYPSSPVARVAEVSRLDLPCKPCSKDGRDACTNSVKLKCLLDVTPSHVARELKGAFESVSEITVLE
jgi:ADP-heptose:LPS heptosyltransferase